MTQYSTVVVDFPWRYKSPGWLGGAARHYDTLPVQAFWEMPIPEIADTDAHLWVWATDTFEQVALNAIALWGFTKRAVFPWIKLSPKAMTEKEVAAALDREEEFVAYNGRFHRLAYGNGYYGRANPEFLILATRGKNIVQQDGRHVRKLIHAPACEQDGYPESAITDDRYFYAPATQHSVKPQRAYDIIFGMSPGPRLDVFGRDPRSGFASWGREAVEPTAVPALDDWSARMAEEHQQISVEEAIHADIDA